MTMVYDESTGLYLAPEDVHILREAYKSVEDNLKLEDAGWVTLGTVVGQNVLTDAERILAVIRSRTYCTKDPLGVQAIRLWTDYTFGSGMSWAAKDDKTKEVLDAFWKSPTNRPVLSSRGQRKSSNKVLIDGEVFFLIFLGPNGATIRTVDPLEITEIITNPDDVEDVRLYKREWTTAQKQTKIVYYRSHTNKDNKPTRDMDGNLRVPTEDGVMYHFANNTIGQRGNPLLLAAFDWIKLYRQFLSSRAAVMIALARFAWKTKIQGGSEAVTTNKAVTESKQPAAGSRLIENLGSDTTPIKADTGAQNAYQDARMLRLQVVATSGFPEQYFGDISTGNLATAKTVELPVQKMISAFQMTWAGVYDDIDQIVLDHAKVPEDKRYVDRDFPAITPEDAVTLSTAIKEMIPLFPDFAGSNDVRQQALMIMGIKNANDVLEQLQTGDAQESQGNPIAKAVKYLQETKELIAQGAGQNGNG